MPPLRPHHPGPSHPSHKPCARPYGLASVSMTVRRKPPLIARRAVHHCTLLQLGTCREQPEHGYEADVGAAVDPHVERLRVGHGRPARKTCSADTKQPASGPDEKKRCSPPLATTELNTSMKKPRQPRPPATGGRAGSGRDGGCRPDRRAAVTKRRHSRLQRQRPCALVRSGR